MNEINEYSIDMQPIDRDLVIKILREYLPENARVWVFGSRAKGTARRFSDLDLLIDVGGTKLDNKIKSDLAWDFEESDLPYKVDIADWNSISGKFKKNVEAHRLELPL